MERNGQASADPFAVSQDSPHIRAVGRLLEVGRLREEREFGCKTAERFIYASRGYLLKTWSRMYMESTVIMLFRDKWISKRNSTIEIIQGLNFKLQKLTEKVGWPRPPQMPRFQRPCICMALCGYARPPPPVPPILLTQNLPSKWIAPTDNMRPKSPCINAWTVVKGLTTHQAPE